MKQCIFALGLSLILGMILIGCDTEIEPPDDDHSPPSAPTGVTVTALSSTSIQISWEPVTGATSYTVYYETGISSAKNFAANISDTSYTHTGLQSNTTYYYYITAKNEWGSSAYSSLKSAKTLSSSGGSSGSLLAPTGVTVTALSSTSIQISWNSVAGATSYDVYYEIGSSTTKNFAANVSDTSYTHIGLQPDTTYWYYIKANNDSASSAYSSLKFAKTLSSSSSIAAPTGVTATALSSSSIQISWNPVAGATSYDVYYEIGSSLTKNFAANVSDTSYTHIGLQPDTTYWYYIMAKNDSASSAYSSYKSAKTLSSSNSLAAPTGVTTTALSSSSIQISWSPVAGATSYDVYYEIGSSSTKNFAANVSETSYTHTGLQPGTYYYYYIKANNEWGSSAYSSLRSGRPIWPPECIETFTGINQTFEGSLNDTTDEKWYKISFSTTALVSIGGVDRQSDLGGEYGIAFTADIVGSVYTSTGSLRSNSQVDIGADVGIIGSITASSTNYLRIEVNPANPYPGTYLIGILSNP